ncbi:hypothetical protein DL769_008900 [Monosporascus sp. CRB-8-3]|nr:hypothetical protein DL769_008900 [Monosporascus sp. CRB-8-3]
MPATNFRRSTLENASNRASVAAGSEARDDAPPDESSFEEYLEDVGATHSMSGHTGISSRNAHSSMPKPRSMRVNRAISATYKPPAKPSGLSSRKRKSEASLKDDVAAYKQNLDHISSRKCLLTLLLPFKEGNLRWLWLRRLSLRLAVVQAAGDSRSENARREKRKKREADGAATTTSSRARAGARSNPGAVSRPDISDVYLPGEVTDFVPVWDTCDEIRRKINVHLKTSGLPQAQFCRDLCAQLNCHK